MTTFLCGSRPGSPITTSPEADHWRGDEPNRTCSYCGSMHPADFEAAVRASANKSDPTHVTPAIGKTYKWYARGPKIEDPGKFYTWHAPDDAYRQRLNAILPAAVEAAAVKIEIQTQDLMEEMALRDRSAGDG